MSDHYFIFLGVHDYVVNENFKPPPLYALLEPENWVHHTPLISDDGVTKAWTKLKIFEKHKNKANKVSSLLCLSNIIKSNYRFIVY